MPNKSNYGNNADWKKKAERTSRTHERTPSSFVNRELSIARASSYRRERSRQSSGRRKRSPSPPPLSRKRQGSVTHRPVEAADKRPRSPKEKPAVDVNRLTDHFGPSVAARSIKKYIRRTPAAAAAALIVGRADTDQPDPMHHRKPRLLPESTLNSEDTSNASSFGTAMSSHLSSQSSNPHLDLDHQRAIVAATRMVWAIADTAEQVANMRPTASANPSSGATQRSPSPSVRPRRGPTPGFLSSRVPGGLAMSSPACSSVSTPSSQTPCAPSPASSRPPSRASTSGADVMPPC